MKNLKKTLTAALVLGSVFITGAFAGGTVISATLRPDIKVTVDGSTKTFYDAKGAVVHPISYQDTTYLPVRAIGGLMGKTVGWNEKAQTISLNTPGSGGSGASSSYSRTNPAPVGTQQTIAVNNYSDKYTVIMTVTDVARGDAAWQKIKEANTYNPAPADGKEYILAKVKATVTSSTDDKAIGFNTYSLQCFSSTNVEYQRTLVVEPKPEFQGNVYKDGTLEGYTAFMIDKTDTAPKFVYGTKYDGTGGIWFSLTK